MSSLRANTGYPVFLTGDFNERSEAYYKVTAGGRAVAASADSRLGAESSSSWSRSACSS